ncbi:XXYS1_4_G0034440.mRNA.1.CDS.1 [Saccharomyces cerevisiae]|nr:XXYS1_4_G0034440.mRNA.1.CDS.1 [Saccharomyces cerevisiae]
MVTNMVKLRNLRRLYCSSRLLRTIQNGRISSVSTISLSKKYTTKSANEGEENVERKHDEEKKDTLKSSSVPTSRISRLFHYGSLAAGVGMNAAAKGISEVAKGNSPTWKSLILSDSNIDRITNKFSKMRGVALKIGQLLSFQDEKVLPKELYEILSRVQNSANHMPQRQLEKVMAKELGANWKTKFSKFDKIPMAAASIGQVHAAELPSGQRVVVKIQYPGVKESIDSDLNSLLMLLTASSLLPKGLFLDKTIANARTELKWECDYNREARALQKFEALLKDDPAFEVPHVFPEYTTDNIITMTRMEGTEIMKLPKASQETKNFISENIMRLCLEEIATFKYMQTDPNWANFLYNGRTKRIELLDFGASRPFAEDFILKYRKLLTYATLRDRKGAYEMSVQLGYLTGLESQSMKDAHVDSVLTLGEPFRGDIDKSFDFKDQTVSDRIRGNIGLMLNERLCPPPEETYSLHRKFSGIFLLCARMGASVHCAKLFKEIFAYKV